LKPIYHVDIRITPKLQAEARRIHDSNAAPFIFERANNTIDANDAAWPRRKGMTRRDARESVIEQPRRIDQWPPMTMSIAQAI
jgi:hypothetical protein